MRPRADLSGLALDQAVTTARSAYACARPESERWFTRATQVLPGGNTRSVLHFEPFPFRVVRAEGKYLEDADGHRYVDLLGNYTAGLLGHSPAAVRTAVQGVLDRGWTLGSVSQDEVRLAELVVERFPSIEQVRFTNSGTEANLMALAAATHHTRRRKVLVFRNGYHGGVLSFSTAHDPVNVPHDWLVCEYNDVDGVGRAFERHGDALACVLVEPVQGSGGCIPAEPAFLDALRRHCDDSGALLVFDEVMTSRLSPGGAQQLLSISPDLTTLGKYLAGGFSFGAFGGRAEVMSHFDRRSGGALGHAGTFNNNVVSMAAGIATLAEVLTDEVLDRTNRLGERLRIGLNEAFAEAGVPMCATGVGSLLSVHGTPGPVRSAGDREHADDRLVELLFFHCLEAGFYLARRGFVALSVEITDADVDQFLAVVRHFDPAG